MKNTQTRWNSASGSDQKDVLWSATPYSGWTTSSENFSKGSEWFIATGLEADTAIPLFRRLSAILRLTILRKFTWTDNIYGQSEIPPGGESCQFQQTHKDEQMFEHEKRNMWQVQEPTSLRLLVVYSLGSYRKWLHHLSNVILLRPTPSAASIW
jgi:hypothetical protein